MKNILLGVILVSLASCQTMRERATGGGGSQLELRQIQTKTFENLTKGQALRASISTLQDLEFIIDKADYILGSVTGTKLTHGVIKITVIVRETKIGVKIRANASQGKSPIAQPDVYQNFFTALDKAVFLVKNKVD